MKELLLQLQGFLCCSCECGCGLEHGWLWDSLIKGWGHCGTYFTPWVITLLFSATFITRVRNKVSLSAQKKIDAAIHEMDSVMMKVNDLRAFFQKDSSESPNKTFFQLLACQTQVLVDDGNRIAKEGETAVSNATEGSVRMSRNCAIVLIAVVLFNLEAVLGLGVFVFLFPFLVARVKAERAVGHIADRLEEQVKKAKPYEALCQAFTEKVIPQADKTLDSLVTQMGPNKAASES